MHPGQVPTPLQGHTQPRTLTVTPTYKLGSPINPTYMLTVCGRKPEYLQKTHSSTKRTCHFNAEKPLLGFELEAHMCNIKARNTVRIRL